MSPSDYVAPTALGEFRAAWEALGADGEVLESYGLSFKSAGEAVSGERGDGGAPAGGVEAPRPHRRSDRRHRVNYLPAPAHSSSASPPPPPSPSRAAVIETLGLSPCEGTGQVKPGATKHNAYLAGVFLGGIKTLARMQVSMEGAGEGGAGGAGSCVLKIGIRSEDRDVSQLLMDLIS